MIWFYGTMACGRVEKIGGSAVATRFRVFNGLPLFPVDSLIEARGPRGGADVAIPLYAKSVIAGYCRVWLPIIALVTLLPGTTPAFVCAAFVMAASVYFWFGFGRLSRASARRRLAYATWFNAPVDVGLVPAGAELPAEEGLRIFLDERATAAPERYRAQRDADARWQASALESSDPELLIAALTLTRYERRKAAPSERSELDALHDKIWAKLDPMLASGGPTAFVEWQRWVNERYARQRKALVPALAIVAVAWAVAVPVVLYLARPRLVIVNASMGNAIDVTLDGDSVARALPATRREGDAGSVIMRVKGGEHELVTRDDRGAEIDRRKFVVPPRTGLDLMSFMDGGETFGSILYAPARSPSLCFFEEIVTYSAIQHLRGYEAVRLDKTPELYVLKEPIESWFEDAPSSVKEGQRATAERRTIRLAPCDTPLGH